MADRAHQAPLATAELLSIGAELLVGETRDSNSGDIARLLTELGVEVRRMMQLPDDLEVIAAAVTEALGHVDVVVTTGGLGPTPDDLTREGIAAALGETPHADAGLERWLRSLWARRGLPFSDANLKQAWLIPGAVALDNPNGTAPGWWVEREDKVVIALPGPPREMHPMWLDHALPRLRERGLGIDRASTTLRLTAIGESALVDLVGKDLLEAANPRMATYARADSVDIRVSATTAYGQRADRIVADAVAALSPRLDAYVFARGDDGWDVALQERMGNRSLAVIELGTAGYVGMLLGNAPFLWDAEQLRSTDDTATGLATAARTRTGADIGLALVCDGSGDDMRVEIGIDLDGTTRKSSIEVFRGGDAGRRRASNAAIAELWRRLAD